MAAVDRSVEDEQRFSENAADFATSMGSSVRLQSPSPPCKAQGLEAKIGLVGVARKTLGICLLLLTVLLWTLSNFMASAIFSDQTYDKPFFLLYANTSVFAFSLIPMFTKYLIRSGFSGLRADMEQMWLDHKHSGPTFKSLAQDDEESQPQQMPLQADENSDNNNDDNYDDDADDNENTEKIEEKRTEKLNLQETAFLSLEFCMLWSLANYLASASLEYTSVASATILTSTSSVWTLVFCALFRVEPYSLNKALGVAASLVGIVLTSTVDLTGGADEDRGSFPEKTTVQIAVGDSMAFLSAVVYGIYVTVMKRRVGSEDRVDMKLFFGLVGVFNLLLLWPLFLVLHWTGIETFELPPEGWIWGIIIVNSLASFISDIAWAFAMLLTTPLVVTVGLSLTIPLSLVGEMIQYGQYSSFVYWIGAAIVFVSFVFVSNESQEGGEIDSVTVESEQTAV